jgi:hypothetical protein
MVFSVSPSVIVREVDATAVIPAVATPPAAIAGVFRWGPTNERILVTSEDELAARFGKPFANTTWQNHETFFAAADFLSYSNALYVTRVSSVSAATATDTYFSAKHAGEIGNSIEVAITSSASFSDVLAEVGDATGTFAFNSNSLNLSLNLAITTAPQINDIIRVGNPTIGYQDLVVSNYVDNAANSAPFTYDISFENRYTLAETDMEELSFERRWGYSNQVSAAPANNTLVHIAVVDRLGGFSGTVGSILELYENVSISPSAKLPDGTTNYYVDILANRSAYIKAIGTDAALGDNIPSAALTGTFASPIYEEFAGGNDGDGEAAISLGRISQGYDLYKDPNEVDISALITGKSTSSNLANYLTQNIAESRKDCVVYASPTYANVVTPANPTDKMNNAITFRNSCTSSSYLVIDTGYKYRYDKYNDTYRWVPLNGDIAGLSARIESWESPAGYKRGVIKNVVKLAFNPNKAQRDQLYGNDINPVISQVGQGVLLFGDKTALGTATGSAFTRINVRRLFITVEKAIATVAASFLFDFNDEFTQTQFKNLVEPFLRDIQGRRGIIDFRVVSDATVNTPDVIDRNIFRGNIFIKPARSINVIELTFVATRTGVEFDEIVGQPL